MVSHLQKLSIQPVIMPLIVDHHAPVYVPPPPIPAPVVVAQPPARVIVAPQPPAPIVINRPPVAPFVHAPVVAPPVVAPVGALPPVPLAHPAAAPALILPHGPKLG